MYRTDPFPLHGLLNRKTGRNRYTRQVYNKKCDSQSLRFVNSWSFVDLEKLIENNKSQEHYISKLKRKLGSTHYLLIWNKLIFYLERHESPPTRHR